MVTDTPPKLEGSRILLLMFGTTRSLYASLYALRLAQKFKADMYILHKGVLAPLVLEEAVELQVSVSFTRKIDIIRVEDIEQIVKEKAIDLIVTPGGIPNAQQLLIHLSVPILFTRHSRIPRDDNKP